MGRTLLSDAFDLDLRSGDRPARASESPKSNAAGESPATTPNLLQWGSDTEKQSQKRRTGVSDPTLGGDADYWTVSATSTLRVTEPSAALTVTV